MYRPIDYSRWDHIECSSDDSGGDGTEQGELEEDDDGADEADLYSLLNDHGLASEDGEREASDEAGTSEAEKVSARALGDAGEMCSADGNTCLCNRESCLASVRKAGETVQCAIAKTAATAAANHLTQIQASLLSLGEQCLMQTQMYVDSISNMQMEEFYDTVKVEQLKTLIGVREEELLANANRLAVECQTLAG